MTTNLACWTLGPAYYSKISKRRTRSVLCVPSPLAKRNSVKVRNRNLQLA
jgi:hypothetical protein